MIGILRNIKFLKDEERPNISEDTSHASSNFEYKRNR